MQRKRRTAKQRAALAYKQQAPLGIGRTTAEVTTMKRRTTALVITAVRAYIWMTRPTCQACHGRRVAECGGLPDEMHEDPPRSKTRGLPPEERFNLLVCARLCAACHKDVTEHRITLTVDPVKGFLGPVEVVPS